MNRKKLFRRGALIDLVYQFNQMNFLKRVMYLIKPTFKVYVTTNRYYNKKARQLYRRLYRKIHTRRNKWYFLFKGIKSQWIQEVNSGKT